MTPVHCLWHIRITTMTIYTTAQCIVYQYCTHMIGVYTRAYHSHHVVIYGSVPSLLCLCLIPCSCDTEGMGKTLAQLHTVSHYDHQWYLIKDLCDHQ